MQARRWLPVLACAAAMHAASAAGASGAAPGRKARPSSPKSEGAAEDTLVADFEGEDYGEWEATGEAFGPGPARGTLAGQMKVTGFLGKGLVNT